MRVLADTNVLVRAAVLDDSQQAQDAVATLREAESLSVSLQSLCELVWVLRSTYKFRNDVIIATLEALIEPASVHVDRDAVARGVDFLRGGGDFADGVIVHEGKRLGAELFASFDRKAIRLAHLHGWSTRQL